MISISTINANTAGNIVFSELGSSILGDRPARVKRVATLDGGAVITHSGVSDSDRTLIIEANISISKEDNLLAVYASETAFLMAFKDGVFYGALSGLQAQNGKIKFNFLIKEKDSD